MFCDQVADFLNRNDIPYSTLFPKDGKWTLFSISPSLSILPVELSLFAERGHAAVIKDLSCIRGEAPSYGRIIFLYEDQWIFNGPLVRARLLSIAGRGEKVFGRNTEIRILSAEQAASFLCKNHLYGPTKAKYSLGLFRYRSTGKEEAGMEQTRPLVAVASFSAVRSGDNGEWRASWDRYASSKGINVIGGAGKILEGFAGLLVREGLSGELTIRSYADSEWSSGDLYRKLGFTECGETEPVAFSIDPKSKKRIHLAKIGRDRLYRRDHPSNLIISNLGSTLYSKSLYLE